MAFVQLDTRVRNSLTGLDRRRRSAQPRQPKMGGHPEYAPAGPSALLLMTTECPMLLQLQLQLEPPYITYRRNQWTSEYMSRSTNQTGRLDLIQDPWATAMSHRDH